MADVCRPRRRLPEGGCSQYRGEQPEIAPARPRGLVAVGGYNLSSRGTLHSLVGYGAESPTVRLSRRAQDTQGAEGEQHDGNEYQQTDDGGAAHCCQVPAPFRTSQRQRLGVDHQGRRGANGQAGAGTRSDDREEVTGVTADTFRCAPGTLFGHLSGFGDRRVTATLTHVQSRWIGSSADGAGDTACGMHLYRTPYRTYYRHLET